MALPDGTMVECIQDLPDALTQLAIMRSDQITLANDWTHGRFPALIDLRC